MASAIAVPTCNLSWRNRPRNLDTHRERIPQARTRTGIEALKNPRGISTLRMITTATATAMNESSPAAEEASAVAGLDRGLVATEADVMTVDATSKKLEASVVDLSTDLDKLQGRWRLVYSSAFASGSLGGFRPGPPTGRLPLTLGQVFQRIDVVGREFDNMVNLQIGTPWPLPPIEVTATLAHKFELIDSASIRIIFERTIVQPAGGLSQIPPFEPPQLPEIFRPPSTLRSGEFKVTFLDDDLRITRGDRGELRVFLKV